MAKDIIKSFDEEIEKQEQLAKSIEEAKVTEAVEAEATEDVAEVPVEEVTEEEVEVVEKSIEADKEEKTKKAKEEDEEAEKSEDSASEEEKEDAKKSEDKEEEDEETEKSEEEDKEEEKVEKSNDTELLLHSVIKSYNQVASQLSILTSEIQSIVSAQGDLAKSLSEIKVMTPAETVAKSIDNTSEEVIEEKAVGFVEKSFVDEGVEEAVKSAHDVETVHPAEVSFDELTKRFKEKYETVAKSITNASQENTHRDLAKSWNRYRNGYASTEDINRINDFINN